MQENYEREILILGIGNILYGDEGVGVHAAQKIEKEYTLPPGVEALDGGTGSFFLVQPMQSSRTVILIDATIDSDPPGTIKRLTPRYTLEYPPTLTAHDIGLKDLLDAFYISGNSPRVILYAVSIGSLGQELGMELSEPIQAILPDICKTVVDDARKIMQERKNLA